MQYIKKNSSIINKFDKLSLDLGLDHSILSHNRKFIYDPIYKILIPIYYDGNISKQKLEFFVKKILIIELKEEILFIEKKKLEKKYNLRSEQLDDTMNCVADIVLSDKKNYFKK